MLMEKIRIMIPIFTPHIMRCVRTPTTAIQKMNEIARAVAVEAAKMPIPLWLRERVAQVVIDEAYGAFITGILSPEDGKGVRCQIIAEALELEAWDRFCRVTSRDQREFIQLSFYIKE